MKKFQGHMNTFFNIRHELHLVENLLFYKERVVVPTRLRNDILNVLHEDHCFIVKMKSKSKSSVYWPGLNSDIEHYVRKCHICGRYRPANIKEPLINHKIPNKPFVKLAADICSYGAKDYLVIIDYFSKWLEILPIHSKTATELIDKFKVVFATHVIPLELIADNIPFGSYKFRKFLEEWGFKVKTSSPRYPRSNGQAESAVKIAKSILKKGCDLQLTLLNYRNTAIIGIGLTPALILTNLKPSLNEPRQQINVIPDSDTELTDCDSIPNCNLNDKTDVDPNTSLRRSVRHPKLPAKFKDFVMT
nr:uncharacterized protein K02A2.6-like [Onthophagus taurus]